MRIPELYESLRYLMLSLETHELRPRFRDAVYEELEVFRKTVYNKNLSDQIKLDAYAESIAFMIRSWEDGRDEEWAQTVKQMLANGVTYEVLK